MSRKITIVGIAGASGAGKSLLARQIYRHLSRHRPPEMVGILTEDAYYRDRSDLSLEQRAEINYDHPAALEHELLYRHLQELRSGRAIEVPQYNYAEHNRTSHTIRLQPPRILLLEGILILHDPQLRALLDLKIFLDVPLDICLTRRLKRDMHERGRTLDSVIHQYEHTVRPMFFKFIDPSKNAADIIVPRGGENHCAQGVILDHLERILNEK